MCTCIYICIYIPLGLRVSVRVRVRVSVSVGVICKMARTMVTQQVYFTFTLVCRLVRVSVSVPYVIHPKVCVV